MLRSWPDRKRGHVFAIRLAPASSSRPQPKRRATSSQFGWPVVRRGQDEGVKRSASVRDFVLVAFAFLVAMAGTTLPTPLYPLYEAEFGFSGLTVTVIFATYGVGVIAGLVLFGNLSDRIGRKPVLLAGLAFGALSAVCFLLAEGLAPILAGRFLSGLSAGLFTGTATAALLDLAPNGDQGRASLVATVVNMGGLGLGPPLAGIVSELLPDPLRLVFLIHIVLLAVSALGVWSVREPGEAGGRFSIRPQALEVPAGVRATFVRAATASFAGFAVLGLFTAISPAFLGQVLGVSNGAAIGGVVLLAFSGSIAGQLTRRAIPDAFALAGGCIVLIAGVAVLSTALLAEILALVVLAALVCGFGQGLGFAASLGMVASAAPEEQRAAVTSSLFVVAYVALSIPVVGIGVLAQATDLVEAGTVFCGFVALLSGAAAASLVFGRSRGSAAPANR
ncbi:MFS transporter [Thermoleophilia bacterium SCSIO 60948]|nr:MFS transporter [Thermoleophilia bacterium SCSIO 60948]